MDIQTIGLDKEQRSDFEMRESFVEAFNLVAPFLSDGGNWLSQFHELQAHDAMAGRFPDIDGIRLFAFLNSIASTKASGRTPAD